MTDEPILLTTTTSWGVRLTLNRPAKLNALNGLLVQALVAALDAAEADPDVRSSSWRALVGPSRPATT